MARWNLLHARPSQDSVRMCGLSGDGTVWGAIFACGTRLVGRWSEIGVHVASCGFNTRPASSGVRKGGERWTPRDEA
jgi:hypothetical protein